MTAKTIFNRIIAAATAVFVVAFVASNLLRNNPTYAETSAQLRSVYLGIGSVIFIWALYRLLRYTLVKDFKMTDLKAVNLISLWGAVSAAIISLVLTFGYPNC